ncbi:beta-lactamase family protein [Fulvivirga sp. M361]|uniref:serine hydrolase domain-containing protein n=1 Tax=Fulvivirga sp. M361 TaxID=2594266 RepID=UPI00117B6804|nr:serine hydrolase domain-containing protein [Fulvivirga sp. M361]TRX61880.1 beta-lactamase family protein [Fulvivirga sp. M361]
MNKIFILFTIGCLIVIRFTYAQSTNYELDQLILNQVDSGKFNGVVLVADQNRIIFQKAYGFASIEKQEPNLITTKFRIGSLTKQFTSMLIMQLVEQEKISLEGQIRNYLPELNLDSKATIEQILHHTSGIQDYTEVEIGCNIDKQMSDTPKEFAKCFQKLQSDFEPGKEWSYSNTNYFLLGILIEKISKTTFEKALKENILDPLQMNNTGYLNKNSENFAQGYTKIDNQLLETDIADIAIAYSAGGMYSSIVDLYKWHKALLTDQLLKKENLDKIFAQNKTVDPSFYGFGWFVDHHWQFKDYRTFHEGGIDGFSACIDRYLDNGICIIVLSNFEFTESRVDLTDPIAKILFESKK